MLKFSIIIPIYNSGKYLRQCIDSCINQTYSNIEILCIDDCSNDNSREIIENIRKTDSRIRSFFNKKNEGTYIARYTGITNAVGDYILFLDSDDILKPYSCAVLSKKIKQKPADIIQFGYEEIPGNHEVYSVFYKSSQERIRAYLAKNNRLSPELWTKAYSSAVIKQACRALELFYAVLAEDLYFSIVITFFSKTFGFLHKSLVYYSKNTGITKRQIYSIEIYKAWLLSYHTVTDKIGVFVKNNIPECEILLQGMESYLLKDFLFHRIPDNLPIKLTHQIYSLLPVYFPEKVFRSFYNEVAYKYTMYNIYLDFECSFKSKIKKLVKLIILSIRYILK